MMSDVIHTASPTKVQENRDRVGSSGNGEIKALYQ
jgi:hypothetical protein